MAILTKKDQMRYIELGNYVVDYTDGDVLVFDNLKDLSPLFPLKPMTTLAAACTSGWQQLIVNGRPMELTQGNILICPPSLKVTCAGHSENFECKVLCTSDHLIRCLLRDKIDRWHHALFVNQTNFIPMDEAAKEDVGLYFSLIRFKLKRNPSAPYDIVMALVRALLLEICNRLEKNNDVEYEDRLSQGKLIFNRFLNLISNSQVKRQPITYYAGQLAITPKYLTMLCLKYSNKTASQWVAQYTVEEIRFYLKSTELSIKEISARLGFSNMSHFGSYVRKHLGVSPSEYRYSKKN